MKIYKINKKITITTIFILFCLGGYLYFPSTGNFQHKSVTVIFLVMLPFLYSKYVLKRTTIFQQFKIGDWKRNLRNMIMSIFFALLIITLIFINTEIAKHYFLPSDVKRQFSQFLIYELLGVSFTVAIYEFFFRGFIQNFYQDYFGKWAIFAQLMFFLIMVLALGLPYWFYISYLIFNLFAGWMVYEGKSILYSALGQIIFIIVLDASFIGLYIK